MAGRLRSIKIFRRIHFIASIIVFMFAFMYILTGMIMSKHNWFPHTGDIKTEKSYPLAFTPDTTNLEALGRDIKDHFDITGRMLYQKNKSGDIIFSIYRPGVFHNITLKSDLESIKIVKTENSSIGLISTRIHRIFGFQGGILYTVWAIILDITAVSVIIFAITGILIWYRFRRLYRFGWFILIPTISLGVVMFVFLL